MKIKSGYYNETFLVGYKLDLCATGGFTHVSMKD